MDLTLGLISTRMAFNLVKTITLPDVNVRKGYVTLGNVNWCNAKPSGTNWPIADALAAALPVDQNMIVASGQTALKPKLDTTIALGNGTWDCAGYWSVAHFAGPGE